MASQKKLSAVITIGGAVAGSLKSALGATTSKLQALGSEVGKLTRRQKLLGESIQVFGRAGKDVDSLRAKYAATTSELGRMRREFDRLNTAQKRADTIKGIGSRVAVAGTAMTATGAAMLAPSVMGTRAASQYATERARINALGLGPETAQHAETFARAMKTLGTSKLENLTLVRDALSVFGDLHHAEMAAPVLAQMKFGNAAMFGAEHGHENEAKFMDMLKVIELRGGTVNQDAFKRQADMVQKVITATGGRVGPEEWRHLIGTGGLAAKGMRDDAFYYQLEPLVQEMGGDRVGSGIAAAYSSLFQGHITKRAANNLQKFGLISDPSKVKHDKAGQISFIDPGALKGADVFRQSQFEWLQKVLLPSLASKGLTTKDQVLDAIGSITNKRGGDILGAMYLNRQQIEKNERMNRGAFGIDKLEAEGAKTPEGRRLRVQQQLADLNLAFGEKVLPIYAKALTVAGDALERLNGFVERHPTLAKAMALGLAGVGAALVTLGPLVVSIGGALATYAGLSLMFEKLGMGGSLFGTAMRLLAAPLRIAGTAVLWLGRALLMNPIGLAVTGIATAAFLIYEYWGPLKTFFTKLWAGIKTEFAGVWDWIVGKVGWLMDAPGKIKAKVSEFFGGGDTAPAGTSAAAGALPDVPPMVSRSATTVQDNSQHTYHIQVPAGTDTRGLADELERRRRQQAGIRARSSLVDGVGVQ